MRLREQQEIRTLALIVLCYGMWGIILFGPVFGPQWLVALFLVPVIAFHSSLQHECIHGHPFTDGRLNDLIAYLPVGIFLPYPRFKENHLTHHQRARISDPVEDPESWYVVSDRWQTFGDFHKFVLRCNNTLAGRFLIGPALSILSLIKTDTKKMTAGDRHLVVIWFGHIAASFALLALIGSFGTISVIGYLAAAYFGMSLLMVRTFLEHQAHPDRRARSVLIDDKGPLRLLFLNNNLHAVHHAFPSVAWYRLPGLFRLHRDRFMEMNQGYFYESYGAVIRSHIFTPKEPVAFPFDRT